MSRRHRYAVGLLVAGALASGVRLAFSEFRAPRPSPTPIEIHAARLSAVRPHLPPSGPVGLMFDEAVITQTFHPYYTTQYVLAPLILDCDTPQDCVLGIFQSSPSGRRLAESAGLTITHDFGDGLLLLRRTRP